MKTASRDRLDEPDRGTSDVPVAEAVGGVRGLSPSVAVCRLEVPAQEREKKKLEFKKRKDQICSDIM